MSKSRCNGKTATGAVCRAAAGPHGLCYFHANPEKARSLGQIGGRKNRARLPEPLVPDSLSAAALLGILAQTIADVRSNAISTHVGGTISQLCNSAFRGLREAQLEARVAALEKQCAERESATPLDTDPSGSSTQDESRGETDANPPDVLTPESGDGAERSNDESGEDEEA